MSARYAVTDTTSASVMPASFNTVCTFDMICRSSGSKPPFTSWPVTGSPPVLPDRYNVSPIRIAGVSGDGVGL